MSNCAPPNPKPDVNTRWSQQLRRNNKTTASWACTLSPARTIFPTTQTLREHAQSNHLEFLPSGNDALEQFRVEYEAERTKDDSHLKPNLDESNKAGPEPPPSKRPHSTPTRLATTRSLSGLGSLNLGDVDMRYLSDDTQPRKRVALGDGISAGSASPFRDNSASPPPPRRSKARPTSAPFGEPESDMYDMQRPVGPRKQLWTDQNAHTPLMRSSIDPSNIASVQVQKARKLSSQPKSTKPRQSFSPAKATTSSGQSAPQNLFSSTSDENYDIILQPETRPISQEQLVAEVKGIYAGLVMVEAKCIEVDNKQATLAQADPDATSPPRLNNEQWQALIALHRTLLHEHHDFFLASQHPSASPALRRLAAKYAMPARMWRYGIHSFLELLRHRLPASLDHMLAFIYLAYSMMALLYETVPSFEDTWIECLGDLGRYRMAIEDDDIRDREVWTGVARHWYSKASDKAPTTGRLYHHLAILARPNALQQLFYYSNSLCVAVPFVSARESVLTLFNPVLEADPTHGQLRLPPLDMAFVKAHGLLFTNKYMEKFEETKKEFLGLLNNQIGRVTRKFMEQGYHIAIANSVAMTGFAAKDNVLMQLIAPSKDGDVAMAGTEQALSTFKLAVGLNNDTLRIVLQRIGDPNVLPFIHVVLVFMYNMTRHVGTMDLLQEDFPWDLLTLMLDTLLSQYKTPDRIETEQFPLPEQDDFRPFPEDFAIRGLLWTEGYFPANWCAKEHIEHPSMTDPGRDIPTRGIASESPPKPYIEPILRQARKAYEYLAEIVFLQKNPNTSFDIPEFSTLRLLYRKAQRSIKRSLRKPQKFLAALVLLGQMQGVTSLPIGKTPTEEVSSVWKTVLLAGILGGILSGIMKFKNWRDTSRLIIPAILVNISCYSIGTDSRISDVDLAVCWVYTAGMNIALVKDKLRRQGRAGGLIALFIALLSILTAIVLAHSLSFQEGERYSNPSTSIVMALLPASLLWEGAFLAVVQCLSSGSRNQVTDEPQSHRFPQGERSRSPVRRNRLDVEANGDYRCTARSTM